MKRILCVLITSVMLLSLTACHNTTSMPTDSVSNLVSDSVEATKDIVEVKEYERAVSYGLVPEGWENDLQKTVSNKEFCELISSLIQITKPEKIDEWNKLAANAMLSDNTMQRFHAAIGLLYAAQALDCCYVHECESSDLQQIQEHPDFWNFVDYSFELWPDLPADYEMLQRTPSTPTGCEFLHGSWGNAANTAIWFVLQRHSLINEKTLLDYDESYDMRWLDNLTREEAIHAVLRLGESESNLLENNKYISVYDNTTYDTTIITEELLNASTDLPTPTHDKLPSSWKGMGISKTKDTVNHYYRDFQEAEIAFLTENGFNFTRIFFNFVSLGYPDFPEDMTMINEQELRELDQLIAWGIKHGVHIQLSISNAFNGSGSFDISDDEWELFRAYWEALAVRYAGIPSCYLTFDLANEIQPSPENVASGVNHLQDVVDSVRNADPNRVLLLSFNDNPWKEWVEGVASLGLSLAYHPYRPTYITKGEQYYYAPGDTPWPYPHFPQILPQSETLSVSGDIGGKALRLDFWVYDPFKVTFDNGETITVTVEGDYIHPDSCGPRFYEPYTIDIPESVTSVTLQPLRNFVAIDEIGIVSDTESHWLIPHDNSEGGADLIWKDGEGWSSEKNCTAETIYQNYIEPIQKAAQEHNVGFMVNEMGSYAADIGWDVSIKQQYDFDLIEILEEHDISWCMCEMDYMSEPYWEVFDEWENTTVENYVHTSDDGHRHTIQYSVELLEMYRQFTVK